MKVLTAVTSETAMPGIHSDPPPPPASLTGLYHFIAPDRFPELGIDPEDVPLGTYAAQDHPPFLPDRFGGNAYGLGLFEQSILQEKEARLLEAVNLEDPKEVAEHYRTVNDLFKRMGLLIRYSRRGRPFYLIPRQFVAHFIVEVRTKAEEIVSFLSSLLSRRLRETMRVGLVADETEMILPEVQSRLPQLEFKLLNSLEAVKRETGSYTALVMIGDPREFIFAQSGEGGWAKTSERKLREDYGYFLPSRFHDLLEAGGEMLCLADTSFSGSREYQEVEFKSAEEMKLFLVFTHIYRTRRRYHGAPDKKLKINRFDFNAFLAGMGVYHETVEGLLGGRALADVSMEEIGDLDYQGLPLPRGSLKRRLASWKRWFGQFFHIQRLETVLPEIQRQEWQARFCTDGDFPATLVLVTGRRKRPAVRLAEVEQRLQAGRLSGCDRALLAGYKDSFRYVGKVLANLSRVREGAYEGLPGLELSRLRKPFETAHRHPQLKHALKLIELAPSLSRRGSRLNPESIMGPLTPVLANLEKLSLMGIGEGPLQEIFLIVTGHSTMSRVTFGKLPETTMQPLTERERYASLEEAVDLLRFYRLLSVAEAEAASPVGLSREQVAEMFALFDQAIRVVTDPELTWGDIIDAEISAMGGVQAWATRKMLKLFNLFEFLGNWQELMATGPCQKEAMADYDGPKLQRIAQVIELVVQIRRFAGGSYNRDSSIRPYFFRALMRCELHGTGRLLPRLGPAAGFTLLWICVHATERRLIDFNPLLAVKSQDQLPARLAKLQRELLALSPEELDPVRLAQLRSRVSQKGGAYFLGSGIHLSLDPISGGFTPRFLDADEEMERLREELDRTLEKDLKDIPRRRLELLGTSFAELTRFTESLERSREEGHDPDPRLSRMSLAIERTGSLLDEYLRGQVFTLGGFADNLSRLADACPNLLGRILPRALSGDSGLQRLAAAAKLGGLITGRLDLWQDMQASHKEARNQFGPTAAGIVGVSPLQFQTLCASFRKIVDAQPRLANMLMLAVLAFGSGDSAWSVEDLAGTPLAASLELEAEDLESLDFILSHYQVFWRIISGQSDLTALEPILGKEDALLVEALYLMSLITTASSREGLLSEDLLERFAALWSGTREMTLRRVSALTAHEEDITERTRQYLAFRRYRDLQKSNSPSASLRYLLEDARLGIEEREEYLEEGLRQSGLDRMLRLRGLFFVSWLDLLMVRHNVPVGYIYRLKGLRSLGPVHFERDLYEARRLYRGLANLNSQCRRALLHGLADARKPVHLRGFDQAAERLAYGNQLRLLFFGLSAALCYRPAPGNPVRVSFSPLARDITDKFEMVNQALSQLKPAEFLASSEASQSLMAAKEGLILSYQDTTRTVSVGVAPSILFDRKVEAILRAKSPRKLKKLYHLELSKLDSTTSQRAGEARRLEEAFQSNLALHGEAMMTRVSQRMAQETSPSLLENIFNHAWEEGLELPLSRERQQGLRDLYEMNLERLRTGFLDKAMDGLERVTTLNGLEELWEATKEELKAHRTHLGKDFDLFVASRFDSRAKEIRIRRPLSL